ADIYFFLAYASAARQESALTRHWLTKYLSTSTCDLELLHGQPVFDLVRHEPRRNKYQHVHDVLMASKFVE
ncbi:MAG: hypothetical protein J7514_09175, partial [Acinetobacter oleivorans]|nr:hypothetical protein [Acinetobacter oleivorans]